MLLRNVLLHLHFSGIWEKRKGRGLIGDNVTDLGDKFTIACSLHFGDIGFVEYGSVDLFAFKSGHNSTQFAKRYDLHIFKSQSVGFQHPPKHIMEGRTFLSNADAFAFDIFELGNSIVVVIGGD